MGLFTKDEKLKIIPQTEESKKGSAYLQNLLDQNVNMPAREIEGMTPVQQELMKLLPSQIANITNASNLTNQLYSDILVGDTYDKDAAQLKNEYEWATKT